MNLKKSQARTLNPKIEIPFSISYVLAGFALIALFANIRVPLPFSPVPLTLQTFAAMLLGALFGRINGTLSVISYLAAISCGLPFVSGGTIDPNVLLGVKGGYLIGMVLQAYIVGYAFEKKTLLFPSLFISSLLQLTLGTLWLSFFIGSKAALFAGFFPFIPGEIIKILSVFTLTTKR